jgi:hypothetical protein
LTELPVGKEICIDSLSVSIGGMSSEKIQKIINRF